MRILMLSWEYPPKSVGGLSNHVYNLSHALKSIGHEVHVITCEEGIAPIEENDNGVYIHRVTPYRIDTEDFTKWIMQLNFSMIEEAARIIRKTGKIDIIHAHDWLSAFSAKTLKWSFNIPMVCTIHATEEGRNNGIRTDMQRYISSTEWFLSYEAWKIISCSHYMKSQILNIFNVEDEKVWVIPNGVDCKAFDIDCDFLSFRRQYALDYEKIVLFVGRHVFEKGVHLLIDAVPGIVSKYSNAKIVIAGIGPMTEELKDKVKRMGLSNKVLFAGYMDDESKNKLYKVADAAVFPSLYEPFGIVALEAMAAGCPVVVSDTGGLAELIDHKYNGMKMINGLTESLRDNVLELLFDEELARYVKKNAERTVSEKYTWGKVAKLTTEMYQKVKEEALDTEWDVDKKIFMEETVIIKKEPVEVKAEKKPEVKGKAAVKGKVKKENINKTNNK